MDLLEKVKFFFILLGNPFICLYHFVITNPFLNIAADDASGLEKIANFALAPIHYILDGKKAVPIEESDKLVYRLEPEFNYSSHFFFRSTAAVTALPFSLAAGLPLKVLSYLFPETRTHHERIVHALTSYPFISNLDLYRQMGIELGDFEKAEMIDKPKHKRRPEAENHLKEERKTFAAIVSILNKYKIPFWLDCGTCLGAYRYGACIPWDIDYDIGTLEPDFQNIFNVLNRELDPSVCTVFDFSGREKPNTYIRVLVKPTGTMLDIYSFDIDPGKKLFSEILSAEFNIFLSEKFKLCEKRFTKPMPFDYIFPLKKAVFEGIEVPVPNKIVPYLQTFYGENLEPVKIYNEITSEYEKDLSHPYWKLAGV
ncbi:MAG TPA: LicD family protein [Rhabdochlamydiaceae bacterium]|nr:LicD family protein [Rhabdochlamydiaceae bacterium]